jgi:Protein of unknown function (DUF1631)
MSLLPADSERLAEGARSLYVKHICAALPALAEALLAASQERLTLRATPEVAQQRADAVRDLMVFRAQWANAIQDAMLDAHDFGARTVFGRALILPDPAEAASPLKLVDDETIETEILAARLGMAMADQAGWEFNDLRSRILYLEQQADLTERDMFQPHVLARVVVESWHQVGLRSSTWQDLSPTIHSGLANVLEEAYHEVNRWLVACEVLPHIDLRPLIRRSISAVAADTAASPNGPAASGGTSSSTPAAKPATAWRAAATSAPGAPGGPATQVSRNEAKDLLAQLSNLLSEVVIGPQSPEPVPGQSDAAPEFEKTWLAPAALKVSRLAGILDAAHHEEPEPYMPAQPAISPALEAAIARAQNGLKVSASTDMETQHQRTVLMSRPMPILQQLEVQKRDLKSAASTALERSTIEIVALLFQSILTEERIPAALRVWFARLQMPVLRVAISEADFLSNLDHPARHLIDRMGSSVMGFGGELAQVDADIEQEFGRIVQVVEAYPDSGRTVFEMVLKELNAFLEKHFRENNATSRKGVTLAQQIEQREAMGVQYTIELRRMLDTVPVQDGIRQFLFEVWADVMALVAVSHGGGSEQARQAKRVASDLVWSAGAKVSREERAEVLRKLPSLLKALREGMATAGLSVADQDQRIRALNEALAAGFTANAATISQSQLNELGDRLEALEQFIPDDLTQLELDETLVNDLHYVTDADLDVVREGGDEPFPATLDWARDLPVGSWYMLDHGGRHESVQLVWRGQRKNLVLFMAASGRGKLFQLSRLASYLQAGLLQPAQEEALTIKATREALDVLNADPARLLR